MKLGGDSSLRKRAKNTTAQVTCNQFSEPLGIPHYIPPLFSQQGTKQPFTETNNATASGKEEKRDQQRHVLIKRQIYLNANFGGRIFHLPRASDMRGPVPDPLPPLGHATRRLSAVCAAMALFCVWDRLEPTQPRSLVPRASRKRCSALTWITKATAARAVSAAVFRFGCGGDSEAARRT